MLALMAMAAPARAETCGYTGDPARVVEECTRIIKSGSAKNLEALYEARADAYWKLNNRQQAVEDLNQATRINSRDPTPFANRGLYFRLMGNLDRAREELDQSIKLSPKNAFAYVQRQIVLRLKSDFDGAVGDCESSLRLSPDALGYSECTNTFWAKHDYDRAMTMASKTLELNPQHVGALGTRGGVYVMRKDWDNAIAELTHALQVDPKYQFGLENRARGYIEVKKLDAALADLDALVKVNPNSAIGHDLRGVTLLRMGKAQESVAALDQAIGLSKTNSVFYYNRAVSRRRLGQNDEAIADLNDSIRLNGNYIPALTARGQALEARGNLDGARNDYAAASKLTAGDELAKNSLKTAQARLAVLGTSGPPVVVQPRPAPQPGPAPAGAGRRPAPVVGNSAYKSRPLTNPVRDAHAFSDMLQRLGYAVVDGYDLDYTAMRRTISDFLVKAASAQLAVVYYAGHGVSLQGHNYLIPVDANLASSRTVNYELFELDQIISSLDDEARTTIIIMDACRNNPFSTVASTRGADPGAGLTGYSRVSTGMLIAFATKPGDVAEDGNGEHSPFTRALLRHLPTPDLEVLDMFRRVRVDVIRDTDNGTSRQTPWENNSLTENVYLGGQSGKASSN